MTKEIESLSDDQIIQTEEENIPDIKENLTKDLEKRINEVEKRFEDFKVVEIKEEHEEEKKPKSKYFFLIGSVSLIGIGLFLIKNSKNNDKEAKA
ncbi:hypothetical protein [Sulfurospirillum sp. 1612]|uniref:hypothetical protein n=1 Tax=Sulfurospirillum sp. 1612 TaxID=3094835 RepID=UPI002F9268B5